MKYIYLFLFMGCTYILSGQEKSDRPAMYSQDTESFHLYPNPVFEDEVNVITSNNSGKDITVYDIFGKVVLRARITTDVLNISRLIPGVYFLQVDQNNKSMTRKLVVK